MLLSAWYKYWVLDLNGGSEQPAQTQLVYIRSSQDTSIIIFSFYYIRIHSPVWLLFYIYQKSKKFFYICFSSISFLAVLIRLFF